MDRLIGQDKIKYYLKTLSLNNMPNSLMIIGDKGSGKHLLVDIISKQLQLSVINLTDKLTPEIIDEINVQVEPHIYIIEDINLNIKNQNSILKFLEEPLKNAYIILLVENKQNILPTVYNRCIIWELESYTKEQLSKFMLTTGTNEILNIVKTPGQVQKFQLPNNEYTKVKDLCDKIITKIPIATFANVLTISDKINFEEDKNYSTEKIDLSVFIAVLIYECLQMILELPNPYYLKIYELSNELCTNLQIIRVNKKLVFENYLTKLKELEPK